MLDEGLRERGLNPLSRFCEVPEIKHACLGGVYALKHALRYLALDTDDRCAIVVSADIAEYARGSSGEPTQGAGAVAMLVERNPRLLKVHLEHIGSASSYRAVDFRKPVLRNIIRGKDWCYNAVAGCDVLPAMPQGFSASVTIVESGSAHQHVKINVELMLGSTVVGLGSATTHFLPGQTVILLIPVTRPTF